MKKIIYIALLVLSILTLSSCSGKTQYNKCCNHIKGHLKDPSSLVVYSAVGYEHEGEYAFKLSYDGKNSFGAYSGASTIYVVLESDGSICCSECDVLSGYSSSMYSIFSLSGKQIYSE